MRNSNTTFWTLGLTVYLSGAAQVQAESYVGLTAGYGFGQKVTGSKGDENLNYPDAPDNSDPTTSLLTGSKISNLKLRTTPMFGVKGGHYFDGLPYLGLEGEALYSEPNFKEQNVTISHPGIAALTGGSDNFTEDQQPAQAKLFIFAANAMLRYQGLKDFTPYIGGGPALYVWKIHGTGLSGITPDLGLPGVMGPTLNERPVTWGTDFKVGAEYAITQGWGLGLEYRYNWTVLKVDNFRSISNSSGDYQGQSVALTVTKHF